MQDSCIGLFCMGIQQNRQKRTQFFGIKQNNYEMKIVIIYVKMLKSTFSCRKKDDIYLEVWA